MRNLIFAVYAALSISGLSAQQSPVSIVDSITYISETGGSNIMDELVLFRADGSYQDLSVESETSGTGFQSDAPMSGTYSFTISQNLDSNGSIQTEGVITWTNGAAQRLPVTLFYGNQVSVAPYFIIFPRIAVTGAANVSNNSWISAAHPTIPGFVIEGNSPRLVLIRGAGPSLAEFNVPTPVANPSMTFSGPRNIDIVMNVGSLSQNGATFTNSVNSWANDPNLVAGFKAIFSLVGAFQFTNGSHDCAGLVVLEPGAYIVNGSTSSAGGQFLTEVYILPYGS